jgi:hypothetical protein
MKRVYNDNKYRSGKLKNRYKKFYDNSGVLSKKYKICTKNTKSSTNGIKNM